MATAGTFGGGPTVIGAAGASSAAGTGKDADTK
jgi:hypothetical protein